MSGSLKSLSLSILYKIDLILTKEYSCNLLKITTLINWQEIFPAVTNNIYNCRMLKVANPEVVNGKREKLPVLKIN
ncbi:hypothetical protein Tfer_2223 [Thermincola ferriacetica]|uniref:Uncharacterized protein n=1 Tax=Thermincola ferriacetica TaxID=281456 RepID=A0A0L6W211_9FIRM|nr:hypothetical protein Tfer_2223 [Thermincola ferriacetica]